DRFTAHVSNAFRVHKVGRVGVHSRYLEGELLCLIQLPRGRLSTCSMRPCGSRRNRRTMLLSRLTGAKACTSGVATASRLASGYVEGCVGPSTQATASALSCGAGWPSGTAS